eukprot:TRINITY_DN71922_c0_g1_i1.p2 TRINITY_DN71922_c0_g1~~TRINITY_DN71922_c0_g1_i1.p2  ORF type:complete len:183 (+),score=33.15 TRINITY_DN71922_c0_g1_i1:229-777(+)
MHGLPIRKAPAHAAWLETIEKEWKTKGDKIRQRAQSMGTSTLEALPPEGEAPCWSTVNFADPGHIARPPPSARPLTHSTALSIETRRSVRAGDGAGGSRLGTAMSGRSRSASGLSALTGKTTESMRQEVRDAVRLEVRRLLKPLGEGDNGGTAFPGPTPEVGNILREMLSRAQKETGETAIT